MNCVYWKEIFYEKLYESFDPKLFLAVEAKNF